MRYVSNCARYFSLSLLVIVGFSCSPVKFYEKDDLVRKHFIAFDSLLSTDPASARAELTQAAKFRFKEHPLTDEWVSTFFSLTRDRKGSLLQHIYLDELTIQMLSETDEKGRAREIKVLQEGLERNKQLAIKLKNEGQDPNTYELTFEVVFLKESLR